MHLPGGYRLTDFAKVGFPVNTIFVALSTLLIPLIWPR